MARLLGSGWLVAVLCVALTGSRFVDKPLPVVPGDFYSGYVEKVFMVQETTEYERQETTTVSISLNWVRKPHFPVYHINTIAAANLHTRSNYYIECIQY